MQCNTCLLVLPLDSFYLHSNGKPRLICKSCFCLKQKPQSKEYRNKKTQEWRKRNPEKVSTSHRVWREANKLKCRERSRTYIIRKQKAMPPWVDRQQIKEIYLSCPEGYHVDHIIPLKGRLVSGLHVPWNLRVIHWKPNSQKGAWTWPDMPFEQLGFHTAL